MEKPADFLEEIYRGAKMGVETIDTVLNKVNDPKMKEELIREQHDFRKFEMKAMEELVKNNQEPKDLPAVQKMGAWMGIQMNTVVDSSPSHIADLMIQGNNMGIVGITKTKNRHTPCRYDALADELVQMQQRHIEQLKPFLK